MQKKVTLIIVLLALAAVIAVLGLNLKNKKNPQTPNQIGKDTAGIQKVTDERLPQLIPADFPGEQGAEVKENFDYTKDGVRQGTRRYVTSQTIAQNTTAFKKYFQDNGWTKLTISSTTGVTIISAAKVELPVSIMVTLSQNSVTKQNLVDITATNQVFLPAIPPATSTSNASTTPKK